MNVLAVFLDVLREAFAKRYVPALFGLLVLGLAGTALALDLDVVEGAIVGSRLFGEILREPMAPADVYLRPVLHAATAVTFHLGMLLGIVATSDIAAGLLAPGRVELLLSLPLRRAELIVGTWLGVLAIALLAAGCAIGGFSLILFVKAGFFTAAPAIGAACAAVGFMAVYAQMLLVTTIARSPALAAGSGLCLYIAGVATSDRDAFLALFDGGVAREVAAFAIAPLPRLQTLASIGMDAASGQPWSLGELAMVLAATLAFSAACIAAACQVTAWKDY